MRKQLSIFFLVFVLIFSTNIFSQDHDYHFLKPIDSIEEMFSHFESSKKVIIANKYLSKAKLINNQIKIINGYFLKSVAHSHTKLAIKYTDSIIESAINIKNNNLLAKGYLHKGVQLYYQAQNEKALDNYLLAKIIYENKNDRFNLIKVKHYIGLLKNNNNQELEALDIFRNNIKYFNRIISAKNTKQYLLSLFALTDSYNRNDIKDSALVFSKIGLVKSKKVKSNLYPFFVISYGITMRDMGKYKIGIDSILKGINLIKYRKKEVSNGYLLVAEAYDALNKEEKYIEYLEKIDSMYKVSPQVIFHARDSYEKLLIHYKNKSNIKKQLELIDKLFAIDSIVNKKSNLLSKKITAKYDIPLLLAEKEILITELQVNKVSNRKYLLILLTLLILLIGYSIYLIRKNIIYKSRFKLIVDKQKEKPVANDIKTDTVRGISEELVEEIIFKLNKFESSKKFLKKEYNLINISKELNTNSTYLSKIINSTKGTNFSNYLNNLRIDYATKRLTNDKKFRLYTIKAISNDSGFNNSQSFSNAFYKKNKLYPSYFIKQLMSIKDDDNQ
jgi:AraC-like DNA-binding protein